LHRERKDLMYRVGIVDYSVGDEFGGGRGSAVKGTEENSRKNSCERKRKVG
jgi:hypothetical protein